MTNLEPSILLPAPEILKSDSAKRAAAQYSSDSDGVCSHGSREAGGIAKATHRVAHVPIFACIDARDNDGTKPSTKRLKRSESSVIVTPLSPPRSAASQPSEQIFNQSSKPEDFLRSILAPLGLEMDSVRVSSDSFLPIAKQQHASYPQAAMAARKEDLSALKNLRDEGHNLQCSNMFGESIVHIICRRGRYDILDFLLGVAKVTVRVRDDMGRTPLHDAAWTDQPNFEVVRRILREAPDLLFVRDNRKHSALAYVPRQNWGKWNQFLEANQGLFLPLAAARVQVVA